jgi:hypothetical protein
VPAAIGAAAMFVIGFAGAVAFENRDQNCAACHTEPETTYVSRLGAMPVDLASAHGVMRDDASRTRCIDCHAGAGPLGRVRSVSLGARNSLAWLTNQPRQPYAGTHPNAFCTQCHDNTEQTRDFDLHSHRYLPDWRAKDPAGAAACATCHVSHETGGAVEAGFLIQQRAQQQCEACHRALDVR